jgi:predicted transcriptional regulator
MEDKVMEEREFIIEIRSKADFLSELHADLLRVESGKKEEEPVERVFFESIDAANRLLTPKRVELLRLLHDEGPMNTHQLAKRLVRDYKNVRLDILSLHEVGLVAKKGRSLSAPWRKITMELRMAA